MDYKCFCYHRLTVRWVKDALQADMGSSRKRVWTCIVYIMPPFFKGACCGTSNPHLADAKPAPACGAQKRCAPPEAAECRGHGLQLHIPHPPNSICRTATPHHLACLRSLVGLELLVDEVAGNGDHRDTAMTMTKAVVLSTKNTSRMFLRALPGRGYSIQEAC